MKTNTPPGQTPPTPQTLTLCLETLRTDGPQALAPEPAGCVRKVTLRGIHLRWLDALHSATCIKSDDVFALALARGLIQLIPEGPQIAKAELDFELTTSTHPCKVTLIPPNTIKCERKSATQYVTSFLEKHRLLRPVTALQKYLPLILTAAALIAPSAPTLDPDDDEQRHPRRSVHHAAFP